MTAKKHAARLALRKSSDQLADEIWEGKWGHIPHLRTTPIGEVAEILAELERRCPGHTKEAYQDAIARSIFIR
jgi:hypothetical protein